MIRIRLDNKEKRVAISLKCEIKENVEKELNLNRVYEETIGSTFERLYANYNKHANPGKANKKLKKDQQTEDEQSENLKQELPFQLFDLENKLVPLETKNIDAWKENYTFKLKDQDFKVCVNLPSIKRLVLPKLLLAGMPAVLRIEHENEDLEDLIEKNSLFKWYCSEDLIPKESDQVDNQVKTNSKKPKKTSINLDGMKWKFICEGIGKKMIILDAECENRLIKVECFPRDDKREGLAVENVTATPVLEKLELENLPMTARHKLTQNRLDSNNLRVMTYNILANCYSDTSLAKEQLYPYCSLEHLDFRYRRVLLVNEIINYNSDIIFLQECETEFLDGDLKSSLLGYTSKFKGKGEKTKEGEAILFRSDRFKFIQSYDISIGQELMNNPMFSNLWNNISKNEEDKNFITSRGTILQVALIESIEKPGNFFLLANTHLFFHPSADFIRLLQSIVSVKYLENLKYKLIENDPNIKKLSILFAGDFNSDPPSQAFRYIFTQQIPVEDMKKEDFDLLKNCEDQLIHSLNLSAYADFPFTNCIGGFEGILDYVFYETDSFELSKVIPLPSVDKVKEFVALPSKYIPSDHLALVFEFIIK